MSTQQRFIDLLLGLLTQLYEGFMEQECSECYSRRINEIEPDDDCEHCGGTGIEPKDLENDHG